MLLGIISDTHDELARTEIAVKRFISVGVDELFHCGDLFSPGIVEICSQLKFTFVFGNHDADMTHLLEEEAKRTGATCLGWGGLVKRNNIKFGLVHGHLTSDLNRILEKNPDYVFSGHFHEPRDWVQGPVRRINPGALHRAERFTIATLDTRTTQLTFIEIDAQQTT